jgi:hypothetical protein
MKIEKRKILNSRFYLWIIIVALISLIIYLENKESFYDRMGNKISAELMNISAKQIKEIELCDNILCNKLIQVEDINSRESKKLFADAMNKIEPYQPNHEIHSHELFIRMYTKNGSSYDIDVYLKKNAKNVAYMHILRQSNPSNRENFIPLGSKQSTKLYDWLAYHNLARSEK